MSATARQSHPLHAPVAPRKADRGNQLRAVVLARSVDALTELTNRLGRAELGQVAASRTNVRALLCALLQPGAVGLFVDDDPLAAAKLRGLRARDALLEAEGGVLSATQVAELLGISRQAVHKRREAGRLLAVETGRRGHLYPAWQFTEQGVLSGLPEVLEALGEAPPPWATLRFFLAGSHRLGRKRPLDVLRRGDVDAVVRVARAFGEHGAA